MEGVGPGSVSYSTAAYCLLQSARRVFDKGYDEGCSLLSLSNLKFELSTWECIELHTYSAKKGSDNQQEYINQRLLLNVQKSNI